MKILGILLAFLLLTGCVSNRGTIASTAVMDVKPETRDDLAACGMGISSSTTVAVKAAIELEKKNGQIDVGLRDELATEFSKRFLPADAVKAMEQYLGCMDKRGAARRADQKQAAISSCKAAWTCNFNQVAGFCNCNRVITEVQKERGLTELQTAQMIKNQCTFDFQQCWPGQNLQKGRADCEAILNDAKISLPVKSTTSACTYEWPPA
jgi:hypothetical protein